MRKFIGAAAAAIAVSLAGASPAEAALLLYQIAPVAGGNAGYTFSFTLDTDRAPSVRTSEILRYAPTTITYTLPGSSTPVTSSASNLGPTFFAAIQQGGISLLRLPTGSDPQPRFFGQPLFTGPTTAPTFLTGTFQLSTQPKNVPSDVQVFDYVLRVTPAVPEPATWAMMLLGFGAMGLTLRRRPGTHLSALA